MKYKFLIFFFTFFTVIRAQEKIDTRISKGHIENYLKKSYELVNTNLDSAMMYNKMADDLLKNLKDDQDKLSVYKNLGSIYLERGNFVNALDYYLKASKIVEQELEKDAKNQTYLSLKTELFILIGNLELRQHNLSDALAFYDKAEAELVKLVDKDRILRSKLSILNNRAGVSLQQKDYSKALGYYERARELNLKLKNQPLEATLLNNMGICYLENKNYSTAKFMIEQALSIRKKLGDQRGIAQCYNNLGKIFGLQEQLEKSKAYFNKALIIGRSVGNSASVLNSLESLHIIYEKKNEFENAYRTVLAYNSLKDSVFNDQSVKKMANLELNYKLDKQKSIYNSNIKEKEKEKMFYYVIGTGLLLLLIISILWIYLQKTKIKNINLNQEKLNLAHKNTILEKDRLKEELDFQNREMTTKIMYLFKKNELILSIAKTLTELKKNASVEDRRIIQNMVVEIRQKKDDNVWDEFETYFTKVHPDFYSNLLEHFPDLTPNEKKLCGFLRLNMSTKDISAITHQTVNSIAVSRSRLRKKLNIQGDEESLINFLLKI